MTALLFKTILFLFLGTLCLTLAIIAYRRPDFRPNHYDGHATVLVALSLGTLTGFILGFTNLYTVFTVLDKFLGVSLG